MPTLPNTAPVRGHIDTRFEMRRAGYKFLGAARCKACDAPIEWWQTTKGAKMPFDPIGSDEEQTSVHWRTCPEADSFRNRNAAAKSVPAKTADPKQQAMDRLSEEAERICRRHQLRAVVLLHEDGHASCFRTGLPPEDLRNEIISAANKVRDDARRSAEQETR